MLVAATFGAAAVVTSLIFASIVYGEGGVAFVARHVLTASLAALLCGWICAPLLFQSRVWGTIAAGILVPVLAQFLYSILMWSLAGASWTGESSLWTHLYVLFVVGLLFAGWVNIPVGVVVSLWLRRRHLAGTI